MSVRQGRWLTWIGGTLALITLLQSAFIIVSGRRIVFCPIRGLEFGSNGMALRLLYDPNGKSSIAWDALETTPQLSTDFDRLIVQLPVAGAVACAVGALTIGIWMEHHARAKTDKPASP